MMHCFTANFMSVAHQLVPIFSYKLLGHYGDSKLCSSVIAISSFELSLKYLKNAVQEKNGDTCLEYVACQLELQ